MKVELLTVKINCNDGEALYFISSDKNIGSVKSISLPITLEVENDNSMGEGREVQGREIPTVCNESETNNGAFRF